MLFILTFTIADRTNIGEFTTFTLSKEFLSFARNFSVFFFIAIVSYPCDI